MGNSMYHYWKSQPEVLRQILEQRKSQTEEFVKLFCAVNPDKLYLIGSGTSLNAERAAAGYMETMLDVDVCAVPSSRIPQLRGERPMVVFISQGARRPTRCRRWNSLPTTRPSVSQGRRNVRSGDAAAIICSLAAEKSSQAPRR